MSAPPPGSTYLLHMHTHCLILQGQGMVLAVFLVSVTLQKQLKEGLALALGFRVQYITAGVCGTTWLLTWLPGSRGGSVHSAFLPPHFCCISLSRRALGFASGCPHLGCVFSLARASQTYPETHLTNVIGSSKPSLADNEGEPVQEP